MTSTKYSERLGHISTKQFQAALDRHSLGQFLSAQAIPFGMFGQNVFVKSINGEYVLRGAAHYDWQFPGEQFIAKLLHEQTSVPVLWPYLLDTDESIFGWKYGYVITPRMPGLQLANKDILKTIRPEDRKEIAVVLGKNLREVQKVTWPTSGRYDLKTNTIKPFKEGFVKWITTELLQHWLQKSLSYQNGATLADKEWIEQIIKDAEKALKVPFTPVLVLHDYKEGNLTVEKKNNTWRVSGLFDLMEALFGDGELDLVRQLKTYMDEDLSLARAFLDGYQNEYSLRPEAKNRLALYIVYDQMIIWEFFHRPENLQMWWSRDKTLKEWITPYIVKLDQLL